MARPLRCLLLHVRRNHFDLCSLFVIEIAGSDDHTVRIWDAQSPQCRCTDVIKIGCSVSAVKFDEKYLVVGSFNASVALWELCSKAEVRKFVGHVAAVFCIDFSATLDLLFTGSADQNVILWRLTTGELLNSVAVECVPRSLVCLRIRDVNGRSSADKYSLIVGNERRVSILAFRTSDYANVYSFLWRESDSNGLSVVRCSDSTCAVVEVVHGTNGELAISSPLMIRQVIEIHEKRLELAGPPAESPSAAVDVWRRNLQICGRILRESPLKLLSPRTFLLGMGSAFSVSMGCHDTSHNLFIHTHPIGSLHHGLLTSMKIPGPTQWLVIDSNWQHLFHCNDCSVTKSNVPSLNRPWNSFCFLLTTAI
jgi:hypothetical protein